MTEEEGIPTATNVPHFGVTVPDLDEAVEFFVDCVGANLLHNFTLPLHLQHSDGIPLHHR